MSAELVIFFAALGKLAVESANDMLGMPRLANRIKVARAEKNVSQEDLAAMVGVSRQTVSSIETGQYCPSTLLAFLLSKRLGKRVDELFYLEEENK
jgi:putative transcriptional regulator